MKAIRFCGLLALPLVAGSLTSCSRTEEAPSTPMGVPTQLAPADDNHSVLEKLRGQWLRPDGGYVLEIRSVLPGGKLEVLYLNPRPIHVARAEAAQAGPTIRVFIELRDVNYPGSTYTLTYEPASDRLVGDYFQAALRQTFEVSFTRIRP